MTDYIVRYKYNSLFDGWSERGKFFTSLKEVTSFVVHAKENPSSFDIQTIERVTKTQSMKMVQEWSLTDG